MADPIPPDAPVTTMTFSLKPVSMAGRFHDCGVTVDPMVPNHGNPDLQAGSEAQKRLCKVYVGFTKNVS
jgi:hypothetical protein